LTEFSAKAARQVDELLAYYEDKDRPEAARNLLSALLYAAQRIDQAPRAGLPAPRPYPGVATPGRYWIKQGAYWIQYLAADNPVITAVYYQAANIPGRL
jgi:plasmid stabilization system protein ParE